MTNVRPLPLADAEAIEAEMRRLEAEPSTTVQAMRLFMQSCMPCGHAVGNLLTCDTPPFGCVICGEPTRAAEETAQAARDDVRLFGSLYRQDGRSGTWYIVSQTTGRPCAQEIQRSIVDALNQIASLRRELAAMTANRDAASAAHVDAASERDDLTLPQNASAAEVMELYDSLLTPEQKAAYFTAFALEALRRLASGEAELAASKATTEDAAVRYLQACTERDELRKALEQEEAKWRTAVLLSREARDSADLRAEELQRDLEAVREALNVPGVWQCPTCHLIKVKSADAPPVLPCPTDGQPMRPVTWKELAESASRSNRQLSEHTAATQDELDRELRATRAALELRTNELVKTTNDLAALRARRAAGG